MRSNFKVIIIMSAVLAVSLSMFWIRIPYKNMAIHLLFDPNLYGDLYPNADITAKLSQTQERVLAKDIKYSYHVNSMGFRGKENIPGDGQKVLLLGDGFAFGIGLEGDQDLGAQLNLVLKKTYPYFPMVVFNGAIPGYTLTDELDYIKEKGAKIRPNLTVVICAADDLWEMERPIVLRRQRKQELKFNFLKMALSGWNKKRWRIYSGSKGYFLYKNNLSEKDGLERVINKYIASSILLSEKINEFGGSLLFALYETPQNKKEVESLSMALGRVSLNFVKISVTGDMLNATLSDGHWTAETTMGMARQIMGWIGENYILNQKYHN